MLAIFVPVISDKRSLLLGGLRDVVIMVGLLLLIFGMLPVQFK
jgi:hypothetical protein